MTTSLAPASGIVRVTISADDKRVDLALPSAVAVAELLPEIARTLGVLDPSSAHTGFRLLGADGTELSASSGLTLQNVQDGVRPFRRELHALLDREVDAAFARQVALLEVKRQADALHFPAALLAAASAAFRALRAS